MPFSLRLRSSSIKEPTSPARTYPEILSKKPYRPLDFWYIRPHDRETLIHHIMPYMARSLRKGHLLEAVLGRHTWADEFVKSELAEATGDESTWFRQTSTAFWIDPATVTDDLLKLTRFWFFTLLRYSYRRYFFEGRKTLRSDLDVRDLYTNRHDYYVSELTEDDVHSLTRRPNKYGASFYRSCYKDVKKCLGWTKFCERVRSFCQSIGLHTSFDNPEKNLRELHQNLTAIMLCRKVQDFSGHLAKNTILVRSTRKEVKKLDGRVTSGATRNDDVVCEMKREIQEISRRFEESPPTSPLLDEPPQRYIEIRADLNTLRSTNEDRFGEIDCDILQKHENSKQLIQSLQSELDQLRNEISCLPIREEKHATADKLVLCRWLLENLPHGKVKDDAIGYRWRQFWQKEWDQYKKKQKSHPLWELHGDGKNNTIGKKLYGTLSDRIHKYGQQRCEKLHPDVQRVVDAIGPVHYDGDGKIDLVAERKRWKVQGELTLS